MELSKNRLKSKKIITQSVVSTNKDTSSKVLKETQISNMHIIVNIKDKFLFLYTFLKKFSDKTILVLVSTNSEAKVSLKINLL